MKILKKYQICDVDQETILNEPISSLDLMERAATKVTQWIENQYPSRKSSFSILAGPGNNGGDGLAIARLLFDLGYIVHCYILFSKSKSAEFESNLKRIRTLHGLEIIHFSDSLPPINAHDVVIDCLFGSGLDRPFAPPITNIIEAVNATNQTIIAVDVPSGVLMDQPTIGISIHAHFTLSFELPKLAFFFAENSKRIGQWHLLPIGLDADSIKEKETIYHYTQRADVTPMLKSRDLFMHKGDFGHALLINGSYGKVGAALLAAKACLRSGAGLLTMHVPRCAYNIVQSSLPEAMVQVDQHEQVFSSADLSTNYGVIGIGCGLGQSSLSAKGLLDILEKFDKPMVIDADALNLLSTHPKWIKKIPSGSILTPHLKEFERIFGKAPNGFARNEIQIEKAKELQVVILLKGAHTAIAAPSGQCYFNSTGNPGMATAGSGDVLTGIITGLLSQGYSSEEAALAGVYLHGLSGDIAASELGATSMIASDIIDHLGLAFMRTQSN